MLRKYFVRNKGSRSIVGRLTAWYSLSIFVLVFLTTSFLYWSLQRTLTSENDLFLHDRLQTITNLLKNSPYPLNSVRRRVESEWSAWHFERVFVQIADQKGIILVQSPGMPKDLVGESFPASLSVERIKTKAKVSYAILSDRIRIGNSQLESMTVNLALDLTNEEKILGRYQYRLFLALVGTSLVSLFLGVRLAKASFRPVQRMIDIASRIGSTTLHERIEDHELPFELKKLAESINTMLERLQTSFTRLTRFSSDVAHELRTPLNNIKGEIEVALGKFRSTEEYREILQSSLEETDRISRIIDGFLFLAQTENPKNQIKKDPIRLDGELRNIVDFYEPTATEEGIAINLSLSDSLTIEAERTLFQRCIGNILSNAINYTSRNGEILVRGTENDNETIIVIADNGIGIPKEDLPYIFDRFYRADSARSPSKLGGYGLGLTIVKSILRLHGGDIEIKSQPNYGTQVTLRFPKSRPSAFLPLNRIDQRITNL